MDSSNAENDELAARAKTEAEANQRKLAVLSLFRLLESAVQTTQLKLGGQIVVPAQEIVGAMLSAKAGFEGHNLDEAVQELREAAEAFRHKTVRWESQARAAQAGHLSLTDAQKRQLPAEIPGVRTASRKTQLLFERLLSELAEMALTARQEEQQPAAETPAAETAEQDAELQPEPEEIRPLLDIEIIDDDFAVENEFAATEDDGADEHAFILSFSLLNTKRIKLEAVDIREAGTLELTFRNSSSETAHLNAQAYNAAEEPILSNPAALQLPATQEKFVKGHISGVAERIDRNTDDTRAVMVEFSDVPAEVDISAAAFR